MNAQNPDMTAATALVPEIDGTATTAPIDHAFAGEFARLQQIGT